MMGTFAFEALAGAAVLFGGVAAATLRILSAQFDRKYHMNGE